MQLKGGESVEAPFFDTPFPVQCCRERKLFSADYGEKKTEDKTLDSGQLQVHFEWAIEKGGNCGVIHDNLHNLLIFHK